MPEPAPPKYFSDSFSLTGADHRGLRTEGASQDVIANPEGLRQTREHKDGVDEFKAPVRRPHMPHRFDLVSSLIPLHSGGSWKVASRAPRRY